MKNTKILSVLLLVVLLISCNSFSYPPLYIETLTITVYENKESESEKNTKVFTDEYLELYLYSIPDGDYTAGVHTLI